MRQILHIFAKDSRRFWPEIAVSLAILVAFVRVYPVQWMGPELFGSADDVERYRRLQGIAGTLALLLPVSWLSLIARVVHGESLVGDRQFWITRPYVWWKLLSAKGLFLIVYFGMPFFLAQIVLLAEAGFASFEYVPGVLYNLTLMTAIAIVPLVALATVTKSVARMLLILLGILLAIVLFLYLAFYVNIASGFMLGGDRVLLPLILLSSGCAIVFQYATRRVWLARGALVLPLVIVALAEMALPHKSTVDAEYLGTTTGTDARAANVAGAPLEIAHDGNREGLRSTFKDKRTDLVGFNLPVTISGVEAGTAVITDDLRMTVEGGHGDQWSSEWQTIFNARYLPGVWHPSVNLMMNRTAYDKFKSMPVTLHVTFAVTEVRAGRATQISLPTQDFAVPEFGICPGAAAGNVGIHGLICRFALHQPGLTHVSSPGSGLPCVQRSSDAEEWGPEPALEAGPDGSEETWVGSLDHEPADIGLTPVSTALVQFHHGDRRVETSLCAGAPITFTRYERVRRTHVDLTITNFRLPNVDEPLVTTPQPSR